MIKVKLTIGERKYTAEGSTLEKAINRIKKPTKITVMGNIRLYKNGKFVKQFPMTLPRLRRLFNSRLAFRQLFIKNLNLFLK